MLFRSRVERDGTIREDGPLSFGGNQIGHVTPDGEVWRDRDIGSSDYVGKIDDNGDVRDAFGNVVDHVDKKD